MNTDYIQVKTAQEMINEMKSFKKEESNTKFGSLFFLTKLVQFVSKLAFFSR